MSALASAPSARGPAHRIRRAAGLLECAAPALTRNTATAVALALGGASALVFVLGDPSKHAAVGVVLAACGVAVLWGVWFARLLLLHVEARQGRMPGLAWELSGAGALAFLLSVPVPALLLAGGGAAPWEAVSVLAAGACVGVLLATMPRIFQLILCLVPALAIVTGDVLDLLLPGGVPITWRPALADVAWLLPLLAGACAWRWHRIVYQDIELSPWWQPAMLSGERPGADWGWFSGNRLTSQMPDVCWPAGQTTGAGPQRPVRSMRALLGTPFAPLSARQIAVQAGAVALAFGYVAVAAAYERTGVSMLAGAGIAGAAVMVLMFGQRLEALYARRSTELDELALLPGLGDAARQRACLLRAVLLPVSVVAAPLLALLAVVIMGAAPGPLAAVVLLMSAAGIVLVTVLACLRPIAGLPMNGWRMLLLAGPVAVLALAGTTGSVMEGGSDDGLLLLGALWIPAFLVLGTMTLSALRRFRRRPHPFLPY